MKADAISSIQQETPDQPDVSRLLEQADARSTLLYPADSRLGLDVDALLLQRVRFFVARVDGLAVGCGGYAVGADGFAELKRSFVAPGARGHGVGRDVVLAIEQAAINERMHCMQLETGVKSVEALRLYKRLGYRKRAPFGTYRADPLSVFMEKRLG